ncbi:MAG: discoidin domain-containing protein [Fibrobacterales bacterium]
MDDIDFSVERGFYDNPFDVVLSTETSDATIFYTLDGSDPCGSATAQSGLTPVTVTVDPSSTYGGLRPITPAVTLKACGSAPSEDDDSDIAVSTYLFIDEIVQQSSNTPGTGWPSPNTGSGQHYDYGMDGSVAPLSEIRNSLLSVPTISMVTELPNLFDPGFGVYENATAAKADDPFGNKWERPGSIELINPNGDDGFQQNCGIRLRGGYSRSDWNPKHSFKVYFDKDYGPKYLEFPLFGDEGVQKYRKIGFRTAQNYSWNMWGDEGDDSRKNTFLREPLARDIQRAQGRLHAKSFNFHLYVNGVYWGLFMVQEAASAKFATQYLGEDKDFYDVINTEGGKADATDGSLDIYYELYEKVKSGNLTDAEYYALQGLASNGTDKDPSQFHYLDAANLIDYMLAIYYTGDKDAPISSWHNNAYLNNFYGIISQVNPEGFQWVRHDAEHSFDVGEENRVGPYDLNGREYFNPQTLHEKLISNDEYKMLFRDLAYRNFYNNGPMTTDSVQSMLSRRINDTEGPITAESARWGDQKSTIPRTKTTWWSAVSNLQNFVTNRTNVVKQQLNDIGWFTDRKPPVATLDASGALINDRFIPSNGDNVVELDPNAVNTTVYYTIDGTDPRAPGGSVSATAQFGGNFATVVGAKVIKARNRQTDGAWSPVREIFFTESIGENVVKFSEIHYKPDELDGDIDENALEFIEITNASDHAVSMAGAKFSKGVLYTFPAETILQAGEYYVIAKNPGEFTRRYGYMPNGHYSDELDNGDEQVEMVDAFGQRIDNVTYADEGEWPESPDGDGPSLNILNLTATTNSDDASNWTASYVLHGTPGFENPADVPVLVTIAVSPVESTIGAGASVTLVASATNQYGTPYTANYTWTTTGTASIVDGVFTASEEGIYVVTVEAEGQSAVAQVEVLAASVLTSFSIAPATGISLEIGTTQQFTATALDQYGNPYDTEVIWAAIGTGHLTSTGLYTATTAGQHSVTASAGTFSDNTQITVTATLINVAAGKPATASTSEASNLAPEFAVDFDGTTRWSSQFKDDQWIMVNLLDAYDISEVVLEWEAAASKHYEIQVSDNGTDWTTVFTETNGDAGRDVISIAPVSARYVRMYGITRATQWGNSLWSFEAWGTKTITFPVLSSITLTPLATTVTVGETQQYTAEGFDQHGNPIDADYSWNISGNSTIDGNGLVTTIEAGIASVTVTSLGLSATTQLTIREIPVLTTIEVSPAASTIFHGGPQQFIARGYDQFGVEVSVDVDWTATAGEILSDGTYIAYDLGTHTVTATDGLISGVTEINVISLPVLTTIEITPGSADIAIGESQQFTAVAFDQYGSEVTSNIVWSTTGNATITTTGLFSAALSGDYTVTAETDAVIATAAVVVSEVNLVQNGDFSNGLTDWYLDLYNPSNATSTVNGDGEVVIDIITPGSAHWNIQFGQLHIPIEVGKKYRYSFDAKAESDRSLSTQIETDGSPWTNYANLTEVPITTVMTNYSFEFVAQETDLDARLVFNVGGINSDVTLNNIKIVEVAEFPNPVLTTIAISQDTQGPVRPRQFVYFEAIGYDQYGRVIAFNAEWVAGSQVHVFPLENNTARAYGESPEEKTVTVQSGAVSATATFTVSFGQAVTQIVIVPNVSELKAGESVQLQALAKGRDGSVIEGVDFIWTSYRDAIATVDANGLLTAISEGTAQFSVTADALTIYSYPEINPTPVPTTISISPSSGTIGYNVTMSMHAILRDQYGTTIPTDFTWSATGGEIDVTTGEYTGTEPGAQVITATASGISQTASITVNAPVIRSIEVTPTNTTIAFGGTQQFSAQAFDMSHNAVPGQFVWTATNGTIDINGLFTSSVEGDATITATSGSISGSAIVTVSDAPVLTTITVSPLTSTVNFGETQQFTAAGFDQFGNSIAAVITWTTEHCTIDPNGLFVGVVEGVTTVTATSGAVSTTVTITVNDEPVLTSMTLTPRTASISIGETQQYTAQALDQNGAVLDVTYNWNASGGIISTSGLFTATTAGSFIISAETGGLVTEATIIVSDAPQNIALNKPTTASSIESGNQASSFAVDPSTETRWSSLHSNNQWIAIDLGGEFDISSVELNWEAAAGESYDIQVKTADNTTWTTIYSETNGNGGIENFDVSASRVTDIRMYGNTRTTIYGFSLYDFQVMGSPSVALPPVLDHIQFPPTVPSVIVGEVVPFAATGIDQYGAPIAAVITYSTTGGTISVSGLFTATELGSFVITAEAEGISATATITVNAAPELDGVLFNPTTLEDVLIGESIQFTAQALDQYGNAFHDVTYEWIMQGDCGTMSNTGLFTATQVSAGNLCSPRVDITPNHPGNTQMLVRAIAVVVTDFVAVNMLVNGDLSNGWSNWDMGIYSTASATRSVNGSIGTIAISNGGTAQWNIQLNQIGVNLEDGETYRFSFSASTVDNRTISATLEKASSPWSFYGGAASVALSPITKDFEYEFTMSGSDNDARVTFNLGSNSNDINISDIQVVKLP